MDCSVHVNDDAEGPSDIPVEPVDPVEPVEPEAEKIPCDEVSTESYVFALVDAKGKYCIKIPQTGAVIGRAALGAEQLIHNSAISREHIRVTYRGRIGVMIEDISKFGTTVNEELLLKNTPKFVRHGDVVKLYDEELILEQIGRREE